jgi:hypothetical protein
MTSRLRIPGRDNRLPLSPLAGLVNSHPQVTFHLSSETSSRIVEHSTPDAEALVADNDDRAELVPARDEPQEEIGSLPVEWTDVASERGEVDGLLPRLRFPLPPAKTGRAQK